MFKLGRMQRIADQLRDGLGRILLEKSNDPRFKLISLTDVKVAKDMSHAKVFFIVARPIQDIAVLEQTLNKAAGFFRTRLAAQLNLRATPKLRFIYDNTLATGRRLSALIDQAVAADTQHMQKQH